MIIPLENVNRLAIHEAGHAVALHACGHALPFLTMATGEDGEHPSWEQYYPGEMKPDCAAVIDEPGVSAACVAGEVAELLAFGNVEDDGPGSDHDNLLAIMDRCTDARKRKQILCDAYDLAETILTQQWPSVLSVAAALEAQKTMSPDEVEDVLRGAGVTA